jgi:Tfp pilus assembly PilM family ATPase
VARFLALDWDNDRLHLVAANLVGGSVKVQHASVWQEGQALTAANAQGLGQKLREHLKSVGVAPAPVLACVGRDRVILKELRFPPVPEAEEAAVVRFQAVKELVDAPDDVVLDYASAAGSSEAERHVLALIVRRDVLASHQALCQAAGLKLAGLCPRAFGLVAGLGQAMGSSPLTPAPESPDATLAVLAVGERFAEFCVFRGERLLLSRSLPVTENLAAEVRRNLIVHAGHAPRHPVEAVYVAGHGTSEVRRRLVELVETPVHTFDPLGQAERLELPAGARGGFAGAAGLLFAWAKDGQLPINFASPRQPALKRRSSPRMLVYGALAVAVFLVGAGVAARVASADMDRKAVEDRARLVSVENEITKTKNDIERAKAINDWDTVVWLDEIYNLARRIPDVNALPITSITTETLSRRGPGTRFIAAYTIKGKILTPDKRPSPLDQLVDEFNKKENAHYSAERPQVRVDETTKETRFTLRVYVEGRSPDDYHELLVPPDPPKAGAPPRKGKGPPRKKK